MKTGRNDMCPCGSNKKFKNCCLGKESAIPVTHKLIFGFLLLTLTVSIVLLVNSIRKHESSDQGGAGLVWSEEHKHWHRE